MVTQKKIQKTALTITRWIGSPASLIVHTILFIASFAAVDIGLIEWSEMLLFVTTLVSLEAIYLSIFIQMTINYTTQELEDVGEDIDEIQKDIDELQEDVEDITEDFEEMTEEEKVDELRKLEQKKALVSIQADLRRLMTDIERFKGNPPTGPAKSDK
ncbi:MAG: hypothetical protein U1D26_02415 [Patescibacteria group bacterium]|nr:hypothetical protein [Patescibacteria group bacterium]